MCRWAARYDSMASEARYRDLVESLSHIVFEMDSRGRFTFANNKAVTLFGYTRDNPPSDLDLSGVIERGDLRRARRDFRGLLAGRRTNSAEYRVRDRNGSTFSVVVFPTCVFRRGRCVGVRGIAIDLTYEKRVRNTVRSALVRTAKAREEERRRIARDLHDDTVQALASLSMQIDATARGDETLSPTAIERLQWLKARTDGILEGLRRICRRLRPDALEQLGLMPALEWLTTEIRNEMGINAHIRIEGAQRRLSPETDLALFRIAQEALGNIRRHSRATEAVLEIRFRRNVVTMKVSDNGEGFQVPGMLMELTDEGRLGLVIMQERACLLGGTFNVRSAPGSGTTVTVGIQA